MERQAQAFGQRALEVMLRALGMRARKKRKPWRVSSLLLLPYVQPPIKKWGAERLRPIYSAQLAR